MRGARERGSYCLSPLSGLAQMEPVNPGFRFTRGYKSGAAARLYKELVFF